MRNSTDLQQERRSHAERISADLELVDKLRANTDHLGQQKDEEILQEDASEREWSIAKELEDLREDEDSQDLQQGKEPLCDSQVIEVLEEVRVPPDNLPTKKKSSMWKRFRHFVGLRKRKRESPESNYGCSIKPK